MTDVDPQATAAEPLQGHSKRIIQRYDRKMPEQLRSRYYGHSHYFNVGYWNADTKTQAQASRQLLEELLKRIPDKSGTILDVACGMGASTRDLLEHYPAENITAINISDKQIEFARTLAPGVNFQQMDAVSLKFPDESFENIICIEAIHHFNPRDGFLQEALRVLKPGGRLVTSDSIGIRVPLKPKVNRLAGPDELRQRYESVGFVNFDYEDATDVTVRPFIANIRRWAEQERKAGTMRYGEYRYAMGFATRMEFLLFRIMGGTDYLLTSAEKPAAAAP